MNHSATVAKMSSELPVVAPSMLKCDFGNLHREVELLAAAGARVLHWDVMDGHFVPNLSYGAMLIRDVRRMTDMVFDAHLMIVDPGKYLGDFLEAGCDFITVHIEAMPEPAPVLERIRAAGRGAGLALNPGTPVERILPFADLVDLFLVMSVEPGFGGQKFIPSALDKLKTLRSAVGPDRLLSVDGGVGMSTIRGTAEAGANVFVAGSSIFDQPDYREAMEKLSLAARGAPSSASGVN